MDEQWILSCYVSKQTMLALKEASIRNDIPIKEYVEQFVMDGLQKSESQH